MEKEQDPESAPAAAAAADDFTDPQQFDACLDSTLTPLWIKMDPSGTVPLCADCYIPMREVSTRRDLDGLTIPGHLYCPRRFVGCKNGHVPLEQWDKLKTEFQNQTRLDSYWTAKVV